MELFQCGVPHREHRSVGVRAWHEMANNLTGDFEAVAQINIRQINGLLATLHQNGVTDDEPLKFLHSTSLRIGDPRRPRPDVFDFGDWVLDYQSAGSPRPFDDLRADLVAT